MTPGLQIRPYLFFGGSCREAMQFYKSIFGGELVLSTYAESPENAHSNLHENAEAIKDNIMHASLTGRVTILASDNPDYIQPKNDGQFAMSLEGADEAFLTDVFHKMCDGGRLLTPLAKQFWGDTFGMVRDQYGIHWMISIKIPA